MMNAKMVQVRTCTSGTALTHRLRARLTHAFRLMLLCMVRCWSDAIIITITPGKVADRLAEYCGLCSCCKKKLSKVQSILEANYACTPYCFLLDSGNGCGQLATTRCMQGCQKMLQTGGPRTRTAQKHPHNWPTSSRESTMLEASKHAPACSEAPHACPPAQGVSHPHMHALHD